MKKNVSQDYINTICELYNDIYDDRVENTCPPTAGSSPCIPGEDWVPGQCAEHKSLLAFQRELQESGIFLSTSKIKKILITGGRWTTARSREIQEMYFRYISEGLKPEAAVACIAAELKISKVSVSVNLPYSSVVYKLEERSSNARRCERYRAKQKASKEYVESQTAPCFAELLRQLDDKSGGVSALGQDSIPPGISFQNFRQERLRRCGVHIQCEEGQVRFLVRRTVHQHQRKIHHQIHRDESISEGSGA